ncbi:IS1182 family transposase [Clostridium sp.]|uniref:IS1182 family transposase n=1 Tax=Clostridium sp. TaxID=1506 RepID=UPI002622453D|nr:IS1182 family transposase [Clostridium sp.]
MNYLLGTDRSQARIECPEDYIDSNNEVRVIDKIIDALNIESLGFKIGNNDFVGRPMFNPRDMLKLFVYGYFNGVRSSRKLAKQVKINKEVIWLINGLEPKYRVIADFRKDNIDSLTKVFESFVQYCIELGLYGKDLIAVDGTKLEASASKRKHYSKNKINKMKQLVQNKVNEYIHDLESNDLSEDNEQIQLKRDEIKSAIQKLENKIKEYDELEKILEDNDVNEINFTDPDAKTVKFGAHQGTDVGYNIQAAVDSKHKLITTFEVTNNSADQGQLYNISNKAKSIFNVESIEALADKGYFEPSDLKECEENKITCYVSKPSYNNSTGNSVYFTDKFKYNPQDNTYTCPEGNKLLCITKKIDATGRSYRNHEACSKCENKYKCTTSKRGRTITRKENEDIVEIINNRTKENKVKYSKRQEIIEHVFGTLKRNMNFTHLLLRGFKKVNGEISIAFFSYNLKRVINILGVKRFLGYLS